MHCLEIIFSSVEYLARQGLPLRGHEDQRGNFINLLNYKQVIARIYEFGWNVEELIYHMRFRMKY